MTSQQSPATQQQLLPWWQPAVHAASAAAHHVQQHLQRLQPPQLPFFQAPVVQPGSNTAAKPPTRLAAANTAAAAAAPLTGTWATPQSPTATSASVSPQLTSHTRHTPKPVTKEELGRATWTFLHTLAAQFPEHPSRQQQRDARTLMDCLTRIYPCADCAAHFKEVIRAEPPAVSSGRDFQAWMCRAHNAVNRRLGKPTFNCELAAARWAPLDCGPSSSCDLTVGTTPAAAAAGRRR